LFAARLDTAQSRAGIDSRLDLNASCQPHALPDSAAAALQNLLKEFKLLFATMDLELTREGEYVFLEANPQGQFLYIEILTKLPISPHWPTCSRVPAGTPFLLASTFRWPPPAR